MYLWVGPYRYAVFLVPNLKNTHSQEPIYAGVDYQLRAFYLDLSLPVHCRKEYLLHEYYHAWEYVFGLHPDEEVRCNHFSAAVTQFTDSLAAAGGIDALQCLEVKIINDEPIPMHTNLRWMDQPVQQVKHMGDLAN